MFHFRTTQHQSAEFIRAEECVKAIYEKGPISFVVRDLENVSDRPLLFELHRKLLLENDQLGIQITRNFILQNYVRHKHYILADKFISAVLPEDYNYNISKSSVSKVQPVIPNESETACFLLHAAVVKTILGDYNTAKKFILESMRKNLGRASPEFQRYTRKLFVMIELLNGSLPATNEDTNHTEMRPYLDLADCLRRGEIGKYTQLIERHSGVFNADSTLLLVARFRHNVLRGALRSICRSYSRIRLDEVSRKLGLDTESVSDVHYIIMKAIFEKVITAKIDFSQHELISWEFESIYKTPKPFIELQSRTEANILFQGHISQMYNAERNPPGIDEEAEEALKKKIHDANQELVKAIEEGVDSDAEWMD